MKRRGNFTNVAIVMMSEVWSDGMADNNTPINDPINEIKQRSPRNPKNNQGVEKIIPAPIPRIKDMIDDKASENNVEAKIIPHNMCVKVKGEVIWRSRPFSRVSIGRITGLIAVEVKNADIATIPMNNRSGEISRPMIHVSTMKNGNINPKIRTGPFLKYNWIFFIK